jgi:hypothetical protein
LPGIGLLKKSNAKQGTLTQPDANLLDNRPFLFSAFMSAALRLVSLLLYQTAIQLSPLSVTIPYLSFTPAMLIVTAYLMIGEQPSWPGLIGVTVVTIGGYLLAFSSTRAQSKKCDEIVELSRVSSPMACEVDENTCGLEMGSNLLLVTETTGHKGVYTAMVRCVLARLAMGQLQQTCLGLFTSLLAWTVHIKPE